MILHFEAMERRVALEAEDVHVGGSGVVNPQAVWVVVHLDWTNNVYKNLFTSILLCVDVDCIIQLSIHEKIAPAERSQWMY